MIYMVEIESPSGARASKEYDAPTMRTAWRDTDIMFTKHPARTGRGVGPAFYKRSGGRRPYHAP